MKSIYSKKKNIDNFNRLKRMLKTLQESKHMDENKKRTAEIERKIKETAEREREYKYEWECASERERYGQEKIKELESRLQTANDTNSILHNTNEMLLKEIPAIKNSLLKIAETLQVLALVIVPPDEVKHDTN
jgi:chromosome segregation ATPase